MFWALSNPPRRLSPAQRHSLTWEAAMQRYAAGVRAVFPCPLELFVAWCAASKLCDLLWICLSCRLETAALLTVEQQRNSKTYYDSLLAWAIEAVSELASLIYDIHH